MHSRSNWLALAACIFLLIAPVPLKALDPLPPLPTPTPSPTPPQILVVPLPTPLPTPTPLSTPAVNPQESIPVVINYGQDQETRTRIYRGVMDPVGVLPNQIVTVTLLLPAAWAGEPVKVGLYDGGQISATSSLGSNVVALRDLRVPSGGKVQLNFQPGPTLGLYRALVTVGSGQYLLKFSAGQLRSSLPPLPGPNLSPPPPPSPPPTPPPTTTKA